MRVLVPGGCGYIGAQLVPVLLSRGHTVRVLDNQWFGDGGLPKDNEHLSMLAVDASKKPYDAVIDLAGLTNNAMCELNPVLDHQNNRGRFVVWLDDAKAKGVQHYIYASSVAAYGSSKEPLTEEAPLRPTTLYGASKVYCEYRLLRQSAFAVTIVRAASVVGASMNMRFDTTMNKMTHDAVRNGVIRVNGGMQVRTHVSIKNLCDFYCLVLEQKITGTYNVVDANLSVRDSALIVRGSCGGEVEYGGSTDQRSYSVDGSKARALGWIPKHGIENAVGDIQARLNSGYWKDSATNDKYQRMRYDLA